MVELLSLTQRSETLEILENYVELHKLRAIIISRTLESICFQFVYLEISDVYDINFG